jgi:hypothetical protein
MVVSDQFTVVFIISQQKILLVVIQLITCDILSLSLGFVIAGYRRPFTDVCLQTSVCRHALYVCSLFYIRIYIAAGWIVHRRIKQVVSDQFRVFVVISQHS